MTDRNEVRLAAIAIVELAERQVADPSRAEDRLDEMEALLADVDAGMVAVELGAMLISVAATCGLPLDVLIAQLRAGVIGGGC